MSTKSSAALRNDADFELRKTAPHVQEFCLLCTHDAWNISFHNTFNSITIPSVRISLTCVSLFGLLIQAVKHYIA
uniref:Uncharacterized protein n=1 Tax=Anguilla anguilla TaxID=7936 RepID=A0A0E9WNS2_ANGAN